MLEHLKFIEGISERFKKNPKRTIITLVIIIILIIAIGFFSEIGKRLVYISRGKLKYSDSTMPMVKKENERGKTTSLELIPNIPRKDFKKCLTNLRNSRQLRELLPLETGKDIAQAPRGTLFFIYPSFLNQTKEENNVSLSLDIGQIDKVRSTHSDFEIHKISENDVLILAYISDETAALISRLDGISPKEVVLFPWPNDDNNTLVSIPFSRFISIKSREISFGDGSYIRILDAIIK